MNKLKKNENFIDYFYYYFRGFIQEGEEKRSLRIPDDACDQ